MALVIIILHKLLKFFVYVHFQLGYSALSSARFKYLPEVEKLLVKYGAKQVCLYLYDNIISLRESSSTNQVWFYIIILLYDSIKIKGFFHTLYHVMHVQSVQPFYNFHSAESPFNIFHSAESAFNIFQLGKI